jgi:hypothetical protein
MDLAYLAAFGVLLLMTFGLVAGCATLESRK